MLLVVWFDINKACLPPSPTLYHLPVQEWDQNRLIESLGTRPAYSVRKLGQYCATQSP